MTDEEAQLVKTCNMVLDHIPRLAPGYWHGVSHEVEPTFMGHVTDMSCVMAVLAHHRGIKVMTSVQEVDGRWTLFVDPFPSGQMIDVTGDVLEQAIRQEKP